MMKLSQLFSKFMGSDFDGVLPYPVSLVKIKKGQVLTDFDQVESNAYFLNAGMVEIEIPSYQTLKTLDFFFEGEFVCAYTSFLTQQPSDVRVVALTACEAEVVSYHDLQRTYGQSPMANYVGRIMNEQAYLRKAQREKDLLTKTAEERYNDLLKKHPEYIVQLPVNKIARYLGIHPESLSRIRKKLNS
jgi:CRP-like cAMP-binding protein